jgi:hypothetical protein
LHLHALTIFARAPSLQEVGAVSRIRPDAGGHRRRSNGRCSNGRQCALRLTRSYVALMRSRR